ncbi:MAG TPA: hypothetical protein VHL77_01110 [Ferruginibacter sp.]|nr:hypothetical protein [Ferruginibacter sp.]
MFMDVAKNKRFGKLMFIVSICMLLIIFYASRFNVYQFTFVGALFEIIWLPLIALLFILPVAAFICWLKEKFRFRSLFLLTLLVCSVNILLLFTIK